MSVRNFSRKRYTKDLEVGHRNGDARAPIVIVGKVMKGQSF